MFGLSETRKLSSLEEYLKLGGYVDSSEELINFVSNLKNLLPNNNTAVALRIFNFVKEIKWGASPIYKASQAFRKRDRPQICVSKAILQVALCRIAKIPARFHCWKVKFSQNVIDRINDALFKKSSQKFRNRELFHVAAEVYLDSWFVADATIDKGLNSIFPPTMWNGKSNAYQKGFEIIEDYGNFADVPEITLKVNRLAVPFYLKPLSPIVSFLANRRINSLLEKLRQRSHGKTCR